MKIFIRIDEDERDLLAADENWIVPAFQRLEERQRPVCVQVLVEVVPAKKKQLLSTPACHAMPMAAHEPTPTEKRIAGLWTGNKLDTNKFTTENLVRFLEQLRELI